MLNSTIYPKAYNILCTVQCDNHCSQVAVRAFHVCLLTQKSNLLPNVYILSRHFLTDRPHGSKRL